MPDPFHSKHDFIVHSETTFNAEPPPPRLRADS